MPKYPTRYVTIHPSLESTKVLIKIEWSRINICLTVSDNETFEYLDISEGSKAPFKIYKDASEQDVYWQNEHSQSNL